MTYILGARCTNGVLLMGDRKVTIDEGADYTYSEKIFKPFTSVVMGSAGVSGLYKSFQDRIIYAVDQFEKSGRIERAETFSIITENTIREMHNVYGEDRHILRELSVLVALRIGERAELRQFTPIGFSEPVNECKAIGHGEPYGAIFLKKMWRSTMTMEQTALLGCFIIKVIQDNKIDNSVGFTQEYLPQVWYIPDLAYSKDMPPFNSEEERLAFFDQLRMKLPIRELKSEEVQSLINKVSDKVEKFNSFFVEGTFKLF